MSKALENDNKTNFQYHRAIIRMTLCDAGYKIPPLTLEAQTDIFR